MSDIQGKPASGAAATETSSTKFPTSSALLADYIPTEQVAAEFDVSSRTVERWVRLKLLPAPLRLGRTSLHHVPSIRKHLADRAECGSRHRRGR
jgi:hypothetical protein